MSLAEQVLTVALCVFGTMLTRFLPFALFSTGKPTPHCIRYLGKALPAALFAMLIVYSLKGVDLRGAHHGMPELIALAATAGLHLWRRQMLLSIAGGTLVFMLLVQLIFS